VIPSEIPFSPRVASSVKEAATATTTLLPEVSPGVASGLSRTTGVNFADRQPQRFSRVDPRRPPAHDPRYLGGNLDHCATLTEALVLAGFHTALGRDSQVLADEASVDGLKWVVITSPKGSSQRSVPQTATPPPHVSPNTLMQVQSLGTDSRVHVHAEVFATALDGLTGATSSNLICHTPGDYWAIDADRPPADGPPFSSGTMLYCHSFIDALVTAGYEEHLGQTACLLELRADQSSDTAADDFQWVVVSSRSFDDRPPSVTFNAYRSVGVSVAARMIDPDRHPNPDPNGDPNGDPAPVGAIVRDSPLAQVEWTAWEHAQARDHNPDPWDLSLRLTPSRAACLPESLDRWPGTHDANGYWTVDLDRPSHLDQRFVGATAFSCHTALNAAVLASYEEADGFHAAIAENSGDRPGSNWLVLSTRPVSGDAERSSDING
jgi:hypothetical protein